jgi:hypothetical protein
MFLRKMRDAVHYACVEAALQPDKTLGNSKKRAAGFCFTPKNHGVFCEFADEGTTFVVRPTHRKP